MAEEEIRICLGIVFWVKII